MSIDVRNEDCPHDWSRVPLSETAQDGKENFIDGDWIEAPYLSNRGIRLIQTGNIGIGVLLDKPDSRKYISPKSFNELRCKWVHPGDILICRLAEPIGRACQVPDSVGDCITAVDVTIFRPHPDRLNSKYAIHLLNSERHLKKLEDVAGGSTRQRISRGNLGRTDICIPHLSEQCRIAEILDTIDDAIQKTEKLIAKLKQVKQGLLHDLLTRGIDENGQLRDAIAHPEQFKDSVLGRIPLEWDVRPLVELAEIRSGIAKNSKKDVQSPIDVHYLRVANVQDGYLDLSEMSKITISKDELDRYAVLPGDVLMNEGGDLDKLGRGALWNGEYSPCIHQNHVFVIRCKPGLLPNYLDTWTGSQPARRYFMIAGKQTTNLASINKTALGQLPVAVPPEDEQERIVSALTAIEFRINRDSKMLDKYRELKKGLIQDLLTGQVRISAMEGENK